MSKLEELIILINKLDSATAKSVLSAQLDARMLSSMRDFVFGAKVFCQADTKDSKTLAKLLTILK